MEHKTLEYTNCEFCGDILDMSHPPPSSAYEAAQIEIAKGTLLLPKGIAKNGGSHARSLEGVYCTPKCLTDNIKYLLGTIKEKPSPKDPIAELNKRSIGKSVEVRNALNEWLMTED